MEKTIVDKLKLDQYESAVVLNMPDDMTQLNLETKNPALQANV